MESSYTVPHERCGGGSSSCDVYCGRLPAGGHQRERIRGWLGQPSLAMAWVNPWVGGDPPDRGRPSRWL